MRTLTLLLILSLTTLAQIIFPPYASDITFYHSFDAGPEADLALGGEKIDWKNGTIKFGDGLRGGKALICGANGGSLRFRRKDTLDFDHPGTLVLFYHPFGWEEQATQKLPRMFIWGIESSQGYIGIQGANDPKNLCMNDREFHLMFLYGKRIPSATYCIPPPGAAGRDGWHMIALSWAGSEYAFKWDHRPLLKFNHPMPVKDSDFPCPVFSIGSASAWNYLLDDVIIYKRRLSNDELDALFRAAF